MKKTTILLPISRDTYLDRIFAGLEMLNCDVRTTSLFVYVDDPTGKLYPIARNFTEQSKFAERLCVQRRAKAARVRIYDLAARRKRIAAIHNEIKKFVNPTDYLLLTEDDTVLPPLALQRLTRDYTERPFAGFISGSELGRHGIPHLGAWRADDVYEPTRIESIMPQQAGVEEIDAAGMYCMLTKYEHYRKYNFEPFGRNDLGPDVAFGLALRQQGLKNYVDHFVRCEHRTPTEVLTVSNTAAMKVIFTKGTRGWGQEVVR